MAPLKQNGRFYPGPPRAVCVLTRRLKPALPIEVARKVIEDFAKVEVVLIGPQTILEAIDIAERYRIPFWDALIVKAAQEARCRVLFTEDLNYGQEIGKLKIVNPFRKD